MDRLAYEVDEFAASIGISSRQARRIIAGGDVRVVRVGSRVLVPAAEAERYIADNAEPWTPANIGRHVGS